MTEEPNKPEPKENSEQPAPAPQPVAPKPVPGAQPPQSSPVLTKPITRKPEDATASADSMERRDFIKWLTLGWAAFAAAAAGYGTLFLRFLFPILAVSFASICIKYNIGIFNYFHVCCVFYT